MYKILSRECVKNRCGKYTVEFSIPWPKDAKTIHLLMDLSSWSPGLFPLTKIGSRGYIRLKLWEGIYLYAFMINLNELAIDPENDFFIKGLKVNYLNKTIFVKYWIFCRNNSSENYIKRIGARMQ